jgi:hypothetical protein
MKQLNFCAGLLALTLVGNLTAAADSSHIRAPELALEVRLTAVRLPDKLDGSVIVTPCAGCAPRSFGLASNVMLQWNNQPISLQSLRQHSLKTSPAGVTLIYAKDSARILRIFGND